MYSFSARSTRSSVSAAPSLCAMDGSIVGGPEDFYCHSKTEQSRLHFYSAVEGNDRAVSSEAFYLFP